MTKPASKTKEVQLTIKELIELESTKDKFKEMLGDKAMSFLYSSMQVVQRDFEIMNCDPKSIINAFEVCASMGLSFEPSLGWAFIAVEKIQKGMVWTRFAQFQIGYKGLIELGHRSDKFKALNADDVREDEYLGTNRMTGEMTFQDIYAPDERLKKPVIGYVAYFKLVNGFEKSMFMTESQMTEHAKTYSKSFREKDSLWNKDRPAMAKKTVLKLLLDKYAPKSTEMQRAIKYDQAIIEDTANGVENAKLNYSDNPKTKTKVSIEENNKNVEQQRIKDHIANAKTLETLEQCFEHLPDEETKALFEKKKKELAKKK